MSNESLFSLSCIWDTFCSFVFIYFWSSLLCPTCARGLLILVYCVSTGNNKLPFYIRSLMFTTSTTFFSCSFCLKGYSFKDPDLPDRLLHHLFCKLDKPTHSSHFYLNLLNKSKDGDIVHVQCQHVLEPVSISKSWQTERLLQKDPDIARYPTKPRSPLICLNSWISGLDFKHLPVAEHAGL